MSKPVGLEPLNYSALDVILKWPLIAVGDVSRFGRYLPIVVALGAGYYVVGVPGAGQSLQTYAMGYGAAGLGYYAGIMFDNSSAGSSMSLK